MGILDGKRILVAGVTMDCSIGFAVARVAQEQGATVLISNFGRALGITRRIAKRLPTEPPVLELDVTDDDHLAGLADAVREHVDGLDGVVHSIAYGNPETLLGGKFLDGPWPDVAQAVQVSAYSLKSLAMACRPLMSSGSSIVGMTFDATIAWPAYDWMGVAKAALESTNRYLARDLGPEGIRVNLVSAGPAEDAGRQGDPGLRGPRVDVEGPRAARLGRERPLADGTCRRRAALRLLPGHDGRDRPRRRRLPRDGRLRLLQPRVDGLRLEGEDGEDRLVHAPQRLAGDVAVERLEPQRVLAQRERALVLQVALAQPGRGCRGAGSRGRR